jgi:hypothetical protein
MGPGRARDESLPPPKLERAPRRGCASFRGAAAFENTSVTRMPSAQPLDCPPRCTPPNAGYAFGNPFHPHPNPLPPIRHCEEPEGRRPA